MAISRIRWKEGKREGYLAFQSEIPILLSYTVPGLFRPLPNILVARYANSKRAEFRTLQLMRGEISSATKNESDIVRYLLSIFAS